MYYCEKCGSGDCCERLNIKDEPTICNMQY